MCSIEDVSQAKDELMDFEKRMAFRLEYEGPFDEKEEADNDKYISFLNTIIGVFEKAPLKGGDHVEIIGDGEIAFKLNDNPPLSLGFSAEGLHKTTGTKYDCEGYDCEGFDENGYSREGCDREDYMMN
jgi:hypothetical protein